jgi:hypothetical protein
MYYYRDATNPKLWDLYLEFVFGLDLYVYFGMWSRFTFQSNFQRLNLDMT